MNERRDKFRKQVALLSPVTDVLPEIFEKSQTVLVSCGEFYSLRNAYEQRLKNDVAKYNKLLDSINKQETDYEYANSLMHTTDINNINKAILLFTNLGGYKNSIELLEDCHKILNDLQNQEKERLTNEAIENQYLHAKILIDAQKYLEAIYELEKLGDYKDSLELKHLAKRLLKEQNSRGHKTKHKIAIPIVVIVIIAGIVFTGMVLGGVFTSNDNQASLPSNTVVSTPAPLVESNLLTITDLNTPSKSTSIDINSLTPNSVLYSNRITFSDLVKSGRVAKIENMDQYRIKITNGVPMTISVKYIYEMMTYEHQGKKGTYTNTVPEPSQFCEVCIYDSNGSLLKKDGFSAGYYGLYSTNDSSELGVYRYGDCEIVIRGDGMSADVKITYE